ncbi:BTAD domain-containing putative transcriptional regulator [Amycolatopsis nigrescens]|uniref:BTAD domain-containing putative transcriptional regulator n=1 Tax=Amycolatopsis nigrescens TaxID=381445 RepID=UPI00047771D5|nr:BTAD domain-containing putative transcriptional regulator [Amycolatopsis nigrescens]
MRFGVLGPLAVWTADGRQVRVPEVKVRMLLADLLVQDGKPVSADRLAEDLWAGRPPGNPTNTLQTKVSQLRRALEDGESGGRELVVHQAPGYLLRAGAEDVDARRFRALTGRARATGEPREKAALLSEALSLWRGPVLAEFADEPFAAPAVRRLTEERLVALEEWAEARLALGEHSLLVGELGDLVAENPLRERLRGLHLRALYRAGRQTEALDSYHELRQRLAEELGLAPGPELTGLHQSILEQDPALDGAPAPVSSTARPRSNLPVPLTELVGRDSAVREVRAMVTGARLVTLTGPGGVGKTRLAVETARELADAVPDGAWLIELAGLDRRLCPEQECPADDWVADVVAATLGIREDPSSWPVDTAQRLADALHGKEILLVLDNCEQLVEPAARLAALLLRAVPGLRVLATSQEPLGLAGEQVWSVPALEVPADLPAVEVLASARKFSAVRLFEARAAAAAPGFELDERTAPAVAAICRRLDGIPLALELAATRVRVLGVPELLSRLDDRFRLLAGGHRDAPERQQTLRAMIDWSWELLTAAERIVLRRLAVHAEGCGLAAAETVCAGDGVKPDEVLDLLARLVDRSLVVSRQSGAGEPRYRLLESVTEYCLERVHEAGEFDRLRLRHSRYYLALAEQAGPLLRGREQRRWLERLDLEAANLRTALETAAQQAEAELALRLANATSWFWFLRGRLNEVRRSLRLALSVPGDAPAGIRAVTSAWAAGFAILEGEGSDSGAFEAAEEIEHPADRAMALWFLGYALATVGDMGTGERLTKLAMTGFDELDDQWGIAAAHSDHANYAMASGDFTGAERNATRSAELFHRIGDRWGELQASFALGALAGITGDYELAARLHRDGLRMAEELGLWPEVSYQLSWLGRVALLTGDFDQAREFHERAMRLAAEQGFKPGEMYAETGLALGARQTGDYDTAEKHLRTVLAWHRRTDFEPASTLILAELGFLAEQRGEQATATELQLEGLALARQTAAPRAVALALEGLAGARALAGEPAHAARLLGAAARLRASVGTPLPDGERTDVDRIGAKARKALGEAVFAAEFEHGAVLELDELVAF